MKPVVDVLAEARAASRGGRGRGRGIVVVTGLGAMPDLPADEHRCLVAGRCPPDSGLVAFAPVNRLIATVIDRLAPDEAAELTERYAAGLRYLDPALLGERSPRVSAMAVHAVAFAIIRRISRESLQAAIHIDLAALFLLNALRRLAKGRPLTVVVPDADLLDRPSLRVLNRLQWLRDPQDDVAFVMLCRGDPFVPADGLGEPLRERLARGRTRLFARLHAEWAPTVIQAAPASPILPAALGEGGSGGPGDDDGDDDDGDGEPIAAIAENLVDHNYDRAYLLAERALAQDPPAATRADILRLVGLCDGNIGEIDLALVALDRALDLAPGRPLRAHLHYLRGLLFTKRRYDLDAADHEYGLGMAELGDRRPGAGGDEDFERAWLINGQALIAALRSRELGLEERQRALHTVLRTELGAFAMVADGSEPGRVYLRHNLLANIAFVLEMLGEFDEAIRFWDKAFGQFLAQPQTAYTFEAVYRYRVGLLEWRAGRPDDAIASLRTALGLADDSTDRFQAERIEYGLAYILMEAGHHDEALAHFSAGLRRAWQLRDPLACLQQASGLQQSADRAGRPHRASAVLLWLRLTGHPTLRAAGEDVTRLPDPPRPAPKLPAYIPGIDLEPTPDVNLNVYLASAAAGGPSSLPPVTAPEPARAAR